MKTNFSVQQIADIAMKVRMYKKLHVTTRGQMFRNKPDAEESVRTLNMIIDDTNEHVGILELTENQVTDEQLRIFGKTPKLFDALFDKAKIPLNKDSKKVEHTRNRETPEADSKEVVSDVNQALGLNKDKNVK